jgi:Na+-transporting NADH:ubiquinone oxidoreductase subunit F
MNVRTIPNYSLTGENSVRAVEKGLAEAEWYTCPVPRQKMRKVLERRDGPAVRDTLLWFALLFGFGVWAVSWWVHSGRQSVNNPPPPVTH